MNQSTAFRRKIIYLVILVATLVPLYLLGQPSDGTADSGGQLATMREDFGIAESDLGEISPASETMKLASLGLRGVAATLLWEKAHEYRITHEWDRLKASLNNIALLQPHYDKVWEHQAHNLAYNVSVEFDDYRQRYEMVREGTEFLTRGVRQNRKAPRLIWYTGWFYGQKIGMSDEKRQFRRLFSDDEVLHTSLEDQGIAVESNEALGPEGKPDNWLVGRLWLQRGYEIVDAGVKIRRQTPLNFFETGHKWSFRHAEAIEKEGILDERAERAWTKASEDWDRFGQRSIPTTSPFTIKLGGLDDLVQQRSDRIAEFKRLAGSTYDDLRQSMLENQPEDVKKVLAKKPEDRTAAGQEMVDQLERDITPDLVKVAYEMPGEKQLTGLQLLQRVNEIDERIQKTQGYRRQINYDYWESLALAEQEERTVRARKLIYDAEKANADAELDLAIELYEKAFAIWAEIFDDYPILTVDDSAEDLFSSIRRYMIAIDSQQLPPNFPLKTFAELMNQADGINDAMQYAEIRRNQKVLAAERRKELEAEERAKEAAAKAAEQSNEEPVDGEEKPNMTEADEDGEELETKSDTEAAVTDEPKTDEPKTDDPKTDDPKTDDPKTDDPKTDDPKTDDPKTDDPKTDDPKTDDPKTDDPKADDPKADDPKADDPKADDPKADDPKTDDPKADDPKADDPKADDPKADDPKADDPKADDPKAEESSEPSSSS